MKTLIDATDDSLPTDKENVRSDTDGNIPRTTIEGNRCFVEFDFKGIRLEFIHKI